MWRKILLLVLLWLLAISPVEADGPFYFPILSRSIHPCQEVAAVSDWKVLAPVTTTNKVKNPSGEIAGNFAALGSATVTGIATFQHYGLYAYDVALTANNDGISLTLDALNNTDHYITLRVFAASGLPAWDWSLDNANYHAPTLLEEIDGVWSLYGLEVESSEANGSTTLYIRQNQSGNFTIRIDGIQVEEKINDGPGWSTYCDGTQPGCEWNGTPHASSSTRSPDSRAGGIVYDLEDDYGFLISGMSGTGTAPQELFIDSYSQLPGGELNARKVGSRVITLTGVITGTDEADFYSKKQTLESLFDPEGVPEDENGEQPVRLRFTGAAVHKEIKVFYETGLEANITADEPCAWERVAIRFIADDPYWYEVGESAALLDTNDSATFRAVAARLRSTGQWSNLGPPHASGTYTDVYALAEDATYVYIGGDFQNFNNIANADGIVRYNKQTGVYSAMSTGINGIVQAIVIAPNGDVIVGGFFENASGVAQADYIAVWAAGASAFTALGTPNMGGSLSIIYSLVYDALGNLIIGGAFLNWAGIAAADNIVKWDGSAYSALSTGRDGGVYAIAISNNIIYAGGNFTDNFALFDGSTWTTISGLDNNVNALKFNGAGLLYVGGDFTTPHSYIMAYHNGVFSPLGSGTNGPVLDLAISPDNTLILSGNFDEAGDIPIADRVARWNGYTFSHLDINLPGSNLVYAILVSSSDPVIPQNYNLYLGFEVSGTGTYAGLETVSNGGTAPAFPKVYFNRSGGTTAIIQTLRNERTGKELLFNWALQNGETLTIDLASPEKSITSSTGSPAQGAVLANSALGDWSLSTGSNDVSSFVSTSGSPTVTAWMVWRDRYKSQN